MWKTFLFLAIQFSQAVLIRLILFSISTDFCLHTVNCIRRPLGFVEIFSGLKIRFIRRYLRQIFVVFLNQINKIDHFCHPQPAFLRIYEVHTISFQTFFVSALLLIVHTWNSSPLRSNLLRLQCTCCTVPTTSEGPMQDLLCERVNDLRHSLFHLLSWLMTTASELSE